ncbi:MAG: caspase family protein [Streptosporangiaceae bacterium]
MSRTEAQHARSALIIATERYADQSLAELRSPARDADALERVLADPSIGDYHVQALLNGSVQAVREAVEDFFADREPGDALLLYLSCHGVKDEEGGLCFAAADTLLSRLQSRSVPAAFIAGQAYRSRSRHIVLMLDCCFSGAFPEGLQARSGDHLSLAPLDSDAGPAQGWAVITSCTAMEHAFEVRGETVTGKALTPAAASVFTAAVVQGLGTGDADGDRDGWVSVDDLYDYVLARVRERTAHQTPEKKGAVRGQLIVARNPRRPAAGPVPVFRPGQAEPVTAASSAIPAASARRRRRMRVTAAAAALLAAAGAGLGFSLENDSSPAAAPPAVNTCARTSSSPSPPTEISSMRVGRTGGYHEDYTDVTAAPGCEVFALAGNGTVQVWNMVTGHRLSILRADPGGFAFAPAFTPDGTMLMVPALNGLTTVWNVESGQQYGVLDSDPAVGTWDAAVSPDGSVLYTGGGTNVVREWSLARRKTVRTIAVSAGIGSLALSPDGKTLAVGGGHGTEFLYDTSTGREIASLPGGKGNAWAVAFSPDGKMLAVATQSGGMQLWDLTTRTLVVHGESGGATAVAFSPDGTILAVGLADSVSLWNVRTRQEITTLNVGTENDFVTGMGFSRYGAVLAIGYDGAVQFWNIAGVSRISE